MSLTEVRDLCLAAGQFEQSGDGAQALTAALRAVEICQASPGREHYAYPLALCAVAWLRAGRGEAGAARSLMDEAVDWAQTLMVSDFEHGLQVLRQAAAFAVDSGDAGLAAKLRTQIHAWHVQELGDEHPRTQMLGAQLEHAVPDATPGRRVGDSGTGAGPSRIQDDLLLPDE